MRTDSLAVVAALAFITTAVAEADKPRIYFPRHIKREFSNATISTIDSLPPPETTTQIDPTTTKGDSLGDFLSSILHGGSTSTRAADVTTISVESTDLPELKRPDTTTRSGVTGSAPDTVLQPTTAEDPTTTIESVATSDVETESDTGILLAPTGIVTRSSTSAAATSSSQADETDSSESSVAAPETTTAATSNSDTDPSSVQTTSSDAASDAETTTSGEAESQTTSGAESASTQSSPDTASASASSASSAASDSESQTTSGDAQTTAATETSDEASATATATDDATTTGDASTTGDAQTSEQTQSASATETDSVPTLGGTATTESAAPTSTDDVDEAESSLISQLSSLLPGSTTATNTEPEVTGSDVIPGATTTTAAETSGTDISDPATISFTDSASATDSATGSQTDVPNTTAATDSSTETNTSDPEVTSDTSAPETTTGPDTTSVPGTVTGTDEPPVTTTDTVPTGDTTSLPDTQVSNTNTETQDPATISEPTGSETTAINPTGTDRATATSDGVSQATNTATTAGDETSVIDNTTAGTSDASGAPTSQPAATTESEDVTAQPSTGPAVPTTTVPTADPITSIRPTATLTNSEEWLPTTIVFEATSISYTPTPHDPTATTSTGLPSNIPKMILPDDPNQPIPDGSVPIQIGFLFPLNYMFVSKNTVAAAQIFKYLPVALADSGGFSTDRILISKIVPYDTRDQWGYITALAKVHYPQSMLDNLQMDLLAPNSALYNNNLEIVRNLTSVINTKVDLFGNVDGDYTGDSGNNDSGSNRNNDAFDNGGSDGQSAKQKATTAGIAVGAFGLSVMYGAAMFIVARRYKRKRQGHRRTSSIGSSQRSSEMRYTGHGSPALMGGALMSRDFSNYGATNDPAVRPGGRDSHGSGRSGMGNSARTAYISAPVAAENSLGWN